MSNTRNLADQIIQDLEDASLVNLWNNIPSEQTFEAKDFVNFFLSDLNTFPNDTFSNDQPPIDLPAQPLSDDVQSGTSPLLQETRTSSTLLNKIPSPPVIKMKLVGGNLHIHPLKPKPWSSQTSKFKLSPNAEFSQQTKSSSEVYAEKNVFTNTPNQIDHSTPLDTYGISPLPLDIYGDYPFSLDTYGNNLLAVEQLENKGEKISKPIKSPSPKPQESYITKFRLVSPTAHKKHANNVISGSGNAPIVNMTNTNSSHSDKEEKILIPVQTPSPKLHEKFMTKFSLVSSPGSRKRQTNNNGDDSSTSPKFIKW